MRNRLVRLIFNRAERGGNGMERFRAARSRASRWRERLKLSDQTVGSARPEPGCCEGYGGESDRALRPRGGRARASTTVKVVKRDRVIGVGGLSMRFF